MNKTIADVKDLKLLNEIIEARERETRAYKRLFGQEPTGVAHEYITIPKTSQLCSLASLLNKPIKKASNAGGHYFEVEYGAYTLMSVSGCE